MMTSENICKKLDKLIPDPHCELIYSTDYEFLISTVLSAQCTDKRVNTVTKELYSKYDIYRLSNAKYEDVVDILMPLGTARKNATYIIEIAKKLVNDYDGKVPNNREYLESLPGVGRKTCNLVLANVFDENTFAVDTHVNRVAIRLNLASVNDSPCGVEEKLMKYFPKEKWSKLHHQFVLFGRYTCKSKNPNCIVCPFKEECNYYKKNAK